eukprot:2132623-Prymnesium_polylepis.1
MLRARLLRLGLGLVLALSLALLVLSSLRVTNGAAWNLAGRAMRAGLAPSRAPVAPRPPPPETALAPPPPPPEADFVEYADPFTDPMASSAMKAVSSAPFKAIDMQAVSARPESSDDSSEEDGQAARHAGKGKGAGKGAGKGVGKGAGK